MSYESQVAARLKKYMQKFYLNRLLKGVILTLALVLSAYLVVNILEYFGRFGTLVRSILFFGFLGAALVSLVAWVVMPIYHLLNKDKSLSDEDAARQIGNFFHTEVSDRLLNFLQLKNTPNANAALVQASLEQKAAQLEPVAFERAVEYKKNRRYLRFLFIPVSLLVGVVLIFSPNFFTQSTERLVKFNEDFIPEAPFSFNLTNKKLTAFRDENFTATLQLDGKALPESVYLLTDRGSKIKMEAQGQGKYAHTFKNVQRPFRFHFEASGFSSYDYELELLERPHLRSFQARLNYPAYTGRRDERVENTGNLIIPEGTQIEWTFSTRQAETMEVYFDAEKQSYPIESAGSENFTFERQIRKSGAYQINLKNAVSQNRDAIAYYLQVIPDEHPEVNLRQYEDSVLYDYLILGGNAADDYGLSQLNLRYRVTDESGKPLSEEYKVQKIEFTAGSTSQEYFHRVDVASLALKPGQRIEYYVEAWDNDGINGSKRSRTSEYRFAIPTKKELRQEIKQESSNTEKGLDKAQKKAEELQDNVKALQDRLKGKKKLSWQDKKAVEELIKKNEELKKQLENAAQKNEELNERQERFSEQEERIAEKAEKLQDLMDEVLDEETQKLFEELNKLLEENSDADDLQKVLDKLQRNSENIEKELDRTLEMFKQLQVELKMEGLKNDLEELAQKQEELAEETKQLDQEDQNQDPEAKDQKQQDIQEEQEKLNEEFQDLQKEMEDLQKENEELERPKNMDDMKSDSQEVEQEQEKAQESLQQQQNQKAAQQQQKAGNKMKQMAGKMEQMMSSGAMQQQMEDYETLRQILDNLMTLSFEQEEVLKGFEQVQQADPTFLELSQRQIKLQDDAQIVEDSLRALAKRVVQIESFITRELTTMNDYMDQSIEAVKERRPRVATTKQQLTMTSINNLALLLNDVLDQMQQSMASMMPGQQMANQKGNSPSLSQMQQQLNDQINGLKKSGKTGRGLSEELAKLAAQQEAIRKALQKSMKEGGDKEGGKKDGGSIGDLLQEMEETEEDLVNKRLTDQLIKRQKDILTRLLESEKANRDRDQDEERESERGKNKKRELPPAFEEYLKLKKQQVEQLKTIPPALSPYYKKEVHEYFQSLKE
ncbi:MAG: DUF4175 family protein [Bacteroidota bacterium]